MNRRLSYNGKELYQMSKEALQAQLKINQLRLKIRMILLLIVALISAFINPFLPIVPIGIALIIRYWLLQNNNAIKEELNKR